MLDFLGGAGSFVFVLGVLVFVHELGHFLVAKRAGIRVDAFSLGFPPTIISKHYKGTDYKLGLIPLGGYVKMAGENPEEESTGSDDEFMSKTIGQRAAVIIAGPAMNYFFAIFLSIFVLITFGRPMPDESSVRVGSVTAGSPAEAAGIVPDDIILAVNDEVVTSFDSMAVRIHPLIDQSAIITWLHGVDTLTKEISPKTSYLPNAEGGLDTMALIGVGRGYVFEPVGLVDGVVDGFMQTNYLIAQTVDFVWMYASGQVPGDAIGGPVFIAQTSGQVAKRGMFWLFSFMALLSINLAVLNVLPVPVLDGGQLVFLLIEKIKGSPLTMKTRVMAQQVGVIAVLGLIVLVTYNDIMRFINTP